MVLDTTNAIVFANWHKMKEINNFLLQTFENFATEDLAQICSNLGLVAMYHIFEVQSNDATANRTKKNHLKDAFSIVTWGWSKSTNPFSQQKLFIAEDGD